MKKTLSLLLALVLLLGCVSALAEPVSLSFFGEMMDEGLYVPSLCGGNEDLYAIVSDNNTYKLTHWRVGMNQPETWDSDVLWNSYCETLDEAKNQTGKEYPCFMDALFIRDGVLHTLGSADGKVFSIGFENGIAKYNEVKALDWEPFEKLREDGYGLRDVKAVGEKLYIAAYVYGQTNPYLLMEYDFETGKGQTVNTKFVNAITPYQDGKLIATIYDENNAYDPATGKQSYATLQILNPKDGSLQKLYDCTETFAGGIQYDPAEDALYFCDTKGIVKMPGLKEPVLCAYASIDRWGSAATALLSGGLYAYVNRIVTVKSTNPSELSKVVLSAMGVGDKARYAFSKDYPTVPVLDAGYDITVDEIIKTGMAKDSTVDVYYIDSRMNLAGLIDKGFALDLSGSEAIRSLMAQMHPVIQKMCMRGDKIYCIPRSGYSPAMCYETYALNNLDLPIGKEDIPTNYLDLLKLMKTWYEEYAEDYPDVVPFDGGKSYLLYCIQNEYINYYAYMGQPLTFDTELFKTLLSALEAIPFPDMSQMNEEDFYKTGLISDMGNPIEGNCDRIGMSLTADTPYIATIEMSFLYVNANSQNAEMATKLLEYTELDYDCEAQVVFFPDRVTAIESPRFQQEKQKYEESLARYTKRLTTCEPGEKAQIEDEIKYLENTLANPERFQYQVTPQTIAQFREMVKDNMIVQSESILYSSGESSDELYSLQERFLNGQIKGEDYIKGIERIVKMMQKEKQ